MRDKPAAASSIRFLVSDGKKNHVAGERDLLSFQHNHHDQLRQAFVFHVLRATSPDVPVSDLSAERRNLPVRGVTGNHIHVIKQNEWPWMGLRLCVGRNSRPQVAAPWRVLECTILNSFLIQNFLVEDRKSVV